ncbi:serine/threonine protein kinase [Butyrivibrio sp. AE2015]|uniref:serine/threonine protein kinase n=1 Tax=Butyrivibrio sp. AE2015 TaxID=1280663 RepID=UPI0003B52FA8|nr:serine/threonine-protein kinase [Butyrivibrio sp. AE2015]
MERFKILKKLGQGGNSEAFLARDKKTGKLVTLKFVKKVPVSGENGEPGPFAVEAAILKEFDKRNYKELVKTGRIPCFVALGKDYIAVSYVPGQNLLEILKKKRRLKEKQVIRIAKDLLTILRALHESDTPIVYRDLKPANIIVNSDGKACLIDFGAARLYKREKETDDTVNLGTIGYAAPEQYGSLGQSDEQTDIYCLGMTVLSLLTGINAKDSDALSMARSGALKNVSPQMLAVIERCIKAGRDNRFKSLKEVEKSIKIIPLKTSTIRLLKVALVVVTALLTSAAITFGAMHEEKAVQVIKDDMEVRIPAIRYRLSIARQRIADIADTLIKEEDI